MKCPGCKSTNEAEALFCKLCGKLLIDPEEKAEKKQRRVYFTILLFVPTLAICVFIGYYKFYLPNDVAAIVNGDEIRESELDFAVGRMKGTGDSDDAYVRHEALNDLITERLVLHAARKAGITVSREEIAAAITRDQAASGLDDEAYSKTVSSMYGSLPGYESEVERNLIMTRFITMKIVPPGSDSVTARRIVNRWIQGAWDHASVRITLREELSGPECDRGVNTCDHALKKSAPAIAAGK
jgi:hypothetical protein